MSGDEGWTPSVQDLAMLGKQEVIVAIEVFAEQAMMPLRAGVMDRSDVLEFFDLTSARMRQTPETVISSEELEDVIARCRRRIEELGETT